MKVQGENSGGVEEVALAILAYLKLHPRAKDSIDGIAKWWVGEERTIVKKALDLLIQRGLCIKLRNHYCSTTFTSSGSV